MSVSFALNGYQPQTLQVRPEAAPQGSEGGAARLQPNPVYAELQPIKPPAKKKPAAKPKQTAQKTTPVAAETSAPGPSTALPASYPWPDPQAR